MRKLVVSGLIVAAGVMSAWAAAGGGPMGITRTELGRGTVGQTYSVGGKGGSDVVVQSVTIEPGAGTGWHTHAGPEVAIVKAGTLTLYDADSPDCAAQTFTPGQVFVRPGHVHQAKNLGSEPLEIVVTYFDVPTGGAAAVPAERPADCPAE